MLPESHAAPPPGALVPGLAAPNERLGRYELLRRLGAGGMAEVHLARIAGLEGFEKLVVVKRILPHLAADPEFVRMFLAEARLVAVLDHPSIVQVFDLGRDGTDYYFAMEYVYGETLQTIVREARRRNQPIALEHAISVVMGAASGLHFAHERVGFDGRPLEIVHRDVSPSNVMVTYDGCVKVADFGIAKVTTRTDVTRAGIRKGKVPYMSPEQCRAERLDRRSDVFSLGILLYETTTMGRLFDGENEFGVMNRIVNGDIPAPSTVRPGYPKELERIVMRALSRDRDRRYATAHELRLDLEIFARDRKLPVSSSGLGDYMHALFNPQPFPWGALQPGPGGSHPASAVTISDLGSGPSCAGSSGARPDITPVSTGSLAGRSRVTITSIDNTRALRGLAIGLGAFALLAVVAVGLLIAANARDDAAAEVEPAAGEVVDAPATPPSTPDSKPAIAPKPAPDEPIDPSGPLEEPEPEPVIVGDEEAPTAGTKPKKKGAGKKGTTKGDKAGKPDLDAFLPQ